MPSQNNLASSRHMICGPNRIGNGGSTPFRQRIILTEGHPLESGASATGGFGEAQESWPPFRVLCVDDNCDAADTTAWLLSHVGFEVRVCYDGYSALRIAEEFRPSVCLIDLTMPGMSGVELAEKLRCQLPNWPMVLVALTAMDTEEVRAQISRAGFQLHLVKPLRPARLIAIVDKLFHLEMPAEPAIVVSPTHASTGARRK
jgi:CheY-like chemotaxis protein